LRILRHEHEESLTDTAKDLGVSHKSVSAWEHARYKIDLKYCVALDERWDTGGLLELLRSFAKEGRQRNWFGDFTRYEREATHLKIFQATTIPGLLQTEVYARMVLVTSRSPRVDLDVTERMTRQRILTGDDPPEMSIILDGRVFDSAPSEIMRGQIEHLLALGEMPHVTLRLVPKRAEWYVGLVGGFHVITSYRRDVVYVDAPGGGRLVHGSETEDFQRRWEDIGTRALPWDLTRDRLITLMEDLA
jgi:hypothetical protein